MRTLWTLLGLLVWPSLYVSMIMPEPKTSSPPQPLWNQSFPDPPPGGLELPPHPGFPLDAPPLYARHPDETPVRRSLQFIPEPDPSYCQMLLEAPVPPPIESVPWFCICSQCKGTIGPKGDHGERGLPGSPGSPGRRGFTGFRGPPGFMGRMGLKGQKGDDGEKGNPGLHGFSGPKGERGFKGDKGDLGLEGPQGPLGPQGEPGQCPDKCETIPSAPGDPGLPGPTGERGLPGEAGPPGAEGEKGDLGPMGPPGAAGADGQKGDQGPEGECECKDGINGTDGQPGPPGHKGEQGLQGIHGDPGINGEKGEKGDLGMTGDPGPCSPTIQSAFSATLGSLYPAPNLPVPFTQVIYNRPGNYNPFTGIYTAPINATYVFSYHLAVSLKPLKVGLFRNFLPVVKSTEVTDLGTTSQQVVLHLNLGDRVWMQVRDSTSNGMYASGECSSTFSGFLLYPDSCDPPMLRDYTPPVEGEYSWGNLPEPSTPSPTTTPTSSSTPEPNPT